MLIPLYFNISFVVSFCKTE